MDSEMSVDPGVGALEDRRLTVNRGSPTVGTPRLGLSGLGSGSPFGEAMGPAASMLRDAIFRRTLMVADIFAIVGAFVLTVEMSSRSLQLTWAGIAALPILLLGAKIFGLYDRDEAVLRKTTLDEAPKLLHVATLCALVAWLTGGVIVTGTLDRHEALFLWLALAVLLVLMRTTARAFALRVAPA